MTSTNASGSQRLDMLAQSLLALLAAVVSGYRAIRSDSPAVITAAFVAALLALVAAAVEVIPIYGSNGHPAAQARIGP